MARDPIGQRSIEEVVEQVQALAAVASEPQVKALATLLARLTIELTSGMGQLSADLFDAKGLIGERLSALTAEIEQTRHQIAAASAASDRQATALVRWTRVQVGVAIAYTVVTGGLLVVAIVRH